jgi:murein DD-endopeptidase MepM/ murein hydrolase activator NlpD
VNRSNVFLRRLRLIVLIAAAVGITFVLVRLVSTSTTLHPRREQRLADLSPAEHGIPDLAYAAVDPAVIPVLEALNGYVAPDPLQVVAAGVPPIGVYLPSTGDTQFKLPPPTPTPAVSPLPTRVPLPTLTPAPTLEPATPGVLPAPQDFGGGDCAPSGWPVAGVLTQYYHWYHRGIDIGMALNTPVVATHSGQVIFAGWRTDGYGNLIILQSGIFITYYAHLTDFNVVAGQIVGRGSVIGWSGSTGNSTGPHVHYEIRINDSEVDPLTFEERGYNSC